MRVLGIDFVVCGFGEEKMSDVVRFYRETLGIEDPIITGDGHSEVWTEFDTKPVALALGKWGHPGQTAIALAVEDVFQAAEELRAKGVKILYGPEEFEPCTMCVIEDPWGHLFVIHRRKDGTWG